MRSDSNYIAQQAANVSAALNTAQIFPLNSNILAASVVNVEASGAFEQVEFEIAASGSVKTNGNYTALMTLFAATVLPGTPLTPGSWTVIGATTARTVNTTSCPYFYRAHLIADSVSGKLQGTFGGGMNNLIDAPAAVTNVVTGVNFAGITEPALIFAFGITFGTADALNIGKLKYFALEC